MSSTVFLQEIDTGLLKFIQEHIFIKEKPVRCQVRKPDEDFKKEDYPLISVYNVYSKRDDTRRCPTVVPVQVDEENKKLIVEQPALPYNLFYQIDFWSLQQSQMNSMIAQWIQATNGGKDFNLPVIDSGGNERSQFCLCKDDLKKSDLVEGKDRIFHSFMTYRIYAEIDENIRSEESLALYIGVETKPGETTPPKKEPETPVEPPTEEGE